MSRNARWAFQPRNPFTVSSHRFLHHCSFWEHHALACMPLPPTCVFLRPPPKAVGDPGALFLHAPRGTRKEASTCSGCGRHKARNAPIKTGHFSLFLRGCVWPWGRPQHLDLVTEPLSRSQSAFSPTTQPEGLSHTVTSVAQAAQRMHMKDASPLCFGSSQSWRTARL